MKVPTRAKGIFLLLQMQRIMDSVKVTTFHRLDARNGWGSLAFKFNSPASLWIHQERKPKGG
jgi:hypothetical protein